MRHSSLSCIGTSLLVGLVIGAAGAAMLSDSKGLRSTKRSAHRAVNAVEDLLCSVKNMVVK